MAAQQQLVERNQPLAQETSANGVGPCFREASASPLPHHWAQANVPSDEAVHVRTGLAHGRETHSCDEAVHVRARVAHGRETHSSDEAVHVRTGVAHGRETHSSDEVVHVRTRVAHGRERDPCEADRVCMEEAFAQAAGLLQRELHVQEWSKRMAALRAQYWKVRQMHFASWQLWRNDVFRLEESHHEHSSRGTAKKKAGFTFLPSGCRSGIAG